MRLANAIRTSSFTFEGRLSKTRTFKTRIHAGGAIVPTAQILLAKSTPDEWGLKVLKLWNSALFGQESIGVLCIEMFWAMGTHIRVRSEPHLERACNPENTRETMLYPGKISERLRLVKK